ncbi:cytochrome P450 [Colletotrichum nymphaeae SA-01]|uniref:Cytochrome P450 n=1 Tax=Colletotrichum nymphaeae SA-01 TaxID=1460502 RepID=A0A135TEL7_9PEZI|nr:cytochrome P450 [Colletotrichum nymphaeae SA-01]
MDSTTLLLHWFPQLASLLSPYSALAVVVVLVTILPMVMDRATAEIPIPKIASSRSWFASRQDFAANGVEIIEKGFKQVKSGVFRVTALDGSDLVLIAPEHWLALCMKTDEEVAPACKESFLCDLHGAPFEEPFFYRYVASPPTRVIMQPKILLIYSHVIWKVILGNSFKPEVVNIFEMYCTTLISVMEALKAQRPIMARIFAAFSKDVRQVNAQLEQASAFFAPLFEQCVQALEQGHAKSSLDNEWLEELIRMAPAERRRDYKYLTNILIGFVFTFVVSPGPLTTQVVYEFAFRPDYVDLVLKEAYGVLGERPEHWGFSRNNLHGLSLLDSFCKETHKHHPKAACESSNFATSNDFTTHHCFPQRMYLEQSDNDQLTDSRSGILAILMKKIHKTQTLPNGVILPAGTILEVVMTAAHLSNPKLGDPSRWNGRRYHDLRQEMTTSIGADKYDWGSATQDDLNFGYASHKCPGRWAGCSIAKMFLTKLLAYYQISPEEGETERYRDVHYGQYVCASPSCASTPEFDNSGRLF